jgi:hypothetical protein
MTFPYMSYGGFPGGMPPFPGYGMTAMPPWWPQPSGAPGQWPAGPVIPTPTPSTTLVPASQTAANPPSSPPPQADFSLADFCATYGLNNTIQQGLEELGFEIGDDLTCLTTDQWRDVGIGLLARKRVLAAYRKYKKDQVDGNI